MAVFTTQKGRDAFRKHLEVQCFRIFKAAAPVDTGFLRSSIKVEEKPVGFDIVINVPYTVYTNERWISPKWNGKQNPNENWFNNAFKQATDYISLAIIGKTTTRKHKLGDNKFEIIKTGRLEDLGQETTNYLGDVKNNDLPNAVRGQTVQEYIDSHYGKGF